MPVQQEPIPVYLICGFLDAGKTNFIAPMLEGEEFTADERTLLLVYRPRLLEGALSHPLARAMLTEAGYPVGAPLPWLLRKLMDRLEGEGDFPLLPLLFCRRTKWQSC